MCRIIFAAKEVDSLWIQGLGPFADWWGDIFERKLAPCLSACSESGSISGDFLAEMLQCLYIFNCSDGIPPFLLLDGHGGRLELPFQEYIVEKVEWTVCVGVPYGLPIGKWETLSSKIGALKWHSIRHRDIFLILLLSLGSILSQRLNLITKLLLSGDGVNLTSVDSLRNQLKQKLRCQPTWLMHCSRTTQSNLSTSTGLQDEKTGSSITFSLTPHPAFM